MFGLQMFTNEGAIPDLSLQNHSTFLVATINHLLVVIIVAI